ncbi:MAG: hypothetical protein Q8N23_05600 [Archangium sp.]|nr:hypothetical protein [Archangium sp.]MDP3152123.1 hypothetical protein [Archangium sp.]MDP3574995.1 hypothetical protein [Archangium sp.]
MPRYREEDGQPCVDVRVPAIENLFDKRDPAPFRDRDLDPGLREYLYDSADDLLSQGPPRLVFWLEKPCEPKSLEEPVREHFTYELERLTRGRRRDVRLGFVTLLIAFGLIAFFIGLAQVVALELTNAFGSALKEALTISGWVLLWRPVEVLIYDGLPWRRRRKVLENLLAAPIDVRVG